LGLVLSTAILLDIFEHPVHCFSSNKKPHSFAKKWGFKTSEPYLPSEQGDWRTGTFKDDSKMGGKVNRIGGVGLWASI
jgi:hypothetical protein